MRRGTVEVTVRPPSTSAGARRRGSREGLGDVEPLTGVGADRFHREVGAVGALGDEEAEVEGGAGDALRGVFGSVGQQLTRGSAEFNTELLTRRGEPMHTKGEVTRTHTNAHHMPEPIRRWPHHTNRVGDILPMGPGLHKPTGGHGGGRHRWPVPGETDSCGGGVQGGQQGRPPGPPVGEEPGGRLRGPLLRTLVHERLGSGERLLDQRTERFLVRHGEQGGVVGPGQVGDLVGDGPAGSGGLDGPALRPQLGHEPVEFLALLTQVVEHARRIGHGGSMAGAPETIKRACIIYA